MRLAKGLRLGDLLGGAAAVVPKSTLVNDLVAYWSLDETSGTRVDLVGDADLSDNNTVGYDTGKNGNAAKFVAGDSESLSVTSPAFAGGDWTMAMWASVGPSPQQDCYLMGVEDYRDWTKTVAIFLWSSNVVRLRYTDGTTYYDTLVGTQLSTDAAWHLWVGQRTGDVYILYKDGEETGRSGTVTGRGANYASSSFTFASNSIPAGYQNAMIDEAGIWSRALTTDEITELYNSGNGKFYNATSQDFEE